MNPQPSALEAAALPIKLQACVERIAARLFYFPVERMLPLELAVLLEFVAVRTLPLVPGRRVVALLAFRTLENYVLSHVRFSIVCLRLPRCAARQNSGPIPIHRRAVRRAETASYSITFVTTPEATVRPPSRMAKRNSSLMAMGVINSADMVMLSPGITISTPSGRDNEPVTSVVRK